jgi:DNA-binding NtrC family response regulator
MANILVVDDEMGIRELLSEILGDEGHVVTTAEHANQAREMRLASSPDLVLLDIWMPDTDGVTLLKEWQRDGLLTMPVIMMSGHATIDTAVEATRIGAMNFLEKPISLQKLLKTVQQGLSRGPENARGAMLNANGRINPMRENGMIAAPPTQPSFDTNEFSNELAEQISYAPPENEFRVSFELPLREARDAFERAYFEHHLIKEGGSMTRVAERTGLERTHLYRKLKQLGVEFPKAQKKTEQE